jgi:hypothetical protein
VKTTTASCADQYPAELEFSAATYRGRKGPGQRFIWWDAGGYEVVGDGQVKIDVATDQQVLYGFSLVGDVLTFTDERRCRFDYQRR